MGEESVLRALRACRPSKTRVLLNPIRIGRRPLTNKKLPRERASPMFSNPTAVTFIGYLIVMVGVGVFAYYYTRCLLYTSPSPRDKRQSRMPSSA